MLFYTVGNGVRLDLQLSLHKNCDCKHYGCGPKNDTHANSFSLWCCPVYLEMKSLSVALGVLPDLVLCLTFCGPPLI